MYPVTPWEKRALKIIRGKVDFFAWGNHPRRRKKTGGWYPDKILDRFRAVRKALNQLEKELEG